MPLTLFYPEYKGRKTSTQAYVKEAVQYPTGINRNYPFHDVTGRERTMPLTFFYPEYKGKKTSTQAYVKEAVKRQQEAVKRQQKEHGASTNEAPGEIR